jgi:hypothetical protein
MAALAVAIGAALLAYWHKPWAIVGAGAFLAALKFLHDVIDE